MLAVQALRPAVVRPHLEEHLGAAAPDRLVEQRLEQRRAYAAPPAFGRHPQGEHVSLPSDAEQAGVASDLTIVHRHQVVPARGLLRELVGQHLPGPGFRTEQREFERDDIVEVGHGHLPQDDHISSVVAGGRARRRS
jgi:hypothetical protein